MEHLYTHAESQRWKRRAALTMGISAGAVALALAVCIVLCTIVTTANAKTLLILAVALFTLAGWAAILLLFFVYAPARAQAEHIFGMLNGEVQQYEGMLTLHRETFRIPKSITVRKATLLTDEGPVSLNVSAALAHRLPTDEKLRLETVRRYIAAYEVIR